MASQSPTHVLPVLLGLLSQRILRCNQAGDKNFLSVLAGWVLLSVFPATGTTDQSATTAPLHRRRSCFLMYRSHQTLTCAPPGMRWCVFLPLAFTLLKEIIMFTMSPVLACKRRFVSFCLKIKDAVILSSSVIQKYSLAYRHEYRDSTMVFTTGSSHTFRLTGFWYIFRRKHFFFSFPIYG